MSTLNATASLVRCAFNNHSLRRRFDWKGVLLPFTMKTNEDSRELYLHGDDAQRPGYTLQELFRLAR